MTSSFRIGRGVVCIHAWLVQLIQALCQDRRGNVMILFAIGAPSLLLAGVATVDYCWVRVDQVKMQGIADSAALAGARQFLIDATSSTAQRAQSFAEAQLTQLSAWSPAVAVLIDDQKQTVSVTISGNRPAFLKNLLPEDGWSVSVTAVAQSEGLMPLCALATATSLGSFTSILTNNAIIDLKNSAQVTAPSCMVQSDQNISVSMTAMMSAGKTQAVGAASGDITPAPQVAAAPISDPFTAVNVDVPSLCTDTDLKITTGSLSLAPGVHCGVIVIGGNATVTLQPGIHYFFAAVVTAKGTSTIQGRGVTLVFDATSTLTFSGNASIDLKGATSGALAGFVILASRDNITTFSISTTAAHVLEGVVYIPNALLDVQGFRPVAESSAWTVIVAKAIAVHGTANLTLNASYSASPVPVPMGVGPNAAGSGAISLIK
ncbi:MAG: pilus assembly protein [Alphaproteobacteria bacterium]|nr:pilus assembly protein [Alphaproteobacteria bacterium]